MQETESDRHQHPDSLLSPALSSLLPLLEVGPCTTPPPNPLTACRAIWSPRAVISHPSVTAPANYSGILTWKSHRRGVGAKKIGPCPKSRSLVPTLSLFHSLHDLLQVTIPSSALGLFLCRMGITPVFSNPFPCKPGANNLASQSLGMFTYKMGR